MNVSMMANIVCVALMIITIIKFIRGDKKSNVWGSVASSIGVLGTFVGIAIGLYRFDANNISTSVPQLLDGMKTAFITSILGMIVSMGMKITQNMLLEKEEEDVDDIEQLFKKMIAESRKTNEALIKSQQQMIDKFNRQENNWIKGQEGLKKEINNLNNNLTEKQNELIDEFKKFGKEMAKNNTDALINALNDVIKDFNNKITEQFGENFKELNKAVGDLLVWQENYKDIIQTTQSDLKIIFKSMSQVEEDINKIAISSTIIKENNEKLSIILNSVDKQQISIEKGLETLAETSKSAIELIPNLDKYFSSSKEYIGKSIDNFQGCLEENANKLNVHIDSVVSDTEQATAVIFEKTKDCIDKNNELFRVNISKYVEEFNTLVDRLSDVIPNLRSNIEDASLRFNNDLGKFTNEISNIIQLQKSCMESQCTTIENTTSNINNRIDTIIVESNKRLEEVTINTSQQIKNIVEEVEKVFTDKVDQLDKLLEIELTNSLNSLGRQLVTVSERFTDDYGRLADKLAEVTKISEGVY